MKWSLILILVFAMVPTAQAETKCKKTILELTGGRPIRGTPAYDALIDRVFKLPAVKQPDEIERAGYALLDFKESPRQKINLESVLQMITKNKVSSVDQLFSILPKDFRSHFLLMSHSKSSQFASPERPRIILHNHDASFIMAFEGDPSKPGYNRIEAMEFDRDNYEFNLTQIDFPSSARGKIKIERNPMRCLACHGISYENHGVHPIWDSYPYWPGNYGSQQSQLSEKEQRNLQNYLDALKEDPENHRRYTFLEGTKYIDPTTFTEAGNYLTIKLDQINADRIIANFFDSPHFLKFAMAIELSLIGSNPSEVIQALPNPNKKALLSKWKNILKSTEVGAREYVKDKRLRQTKASGKPDFFDDRGLEPDDLKELASIRLVAEEMGLDSQNWAMSRIPGVFDFKDGLVGTHIERFRNSWRDQLILRYGVLKASDL